MNHEEVIILAIESSCDDTSAAVLQGRKVLSNIIAGQKVHEEFGGVVPELASRTHQQNIVPVVQSALNHAGVTPNDLNAIAFTLGPGLIGSLLVGVTFSKAMALALNIPLVHVDHLEAHVLAHFIEGQHPSPPPFPFLCLTVSGGHTQILRIDSPFELHIIGNTIDDAAGEAFDKAAKIMGLPYPGGPLIDKLSQQGNPEGIRLALPKIPDLDFSFSGLKTSFLYHIRDHLKENPAYIEERRNDLAAAMQQAIVKSLIDKLILASKKTGIKHIALAGGVSANSHLRKTVVDTGEEKGWTTYIPEFRYTTDNAAMIGIAGWFKYKEGIFTDQLATPYASASSKPAGNPNASGYPQVPLYWSCPG